MGEEHFSGFECSGVIPSLLLGEYSFVIWWQHNGSLGGVNHLRFLLTLRLSNNEFKCPI